MNDLEKITRYREAKQTLEKAKTNELKIRMDIIASMEGYDEANEGTLREIIIEKRYGKIYELIALRKINRRIDESQCESTVAKLTANHGSKLTQFYWSRLLDYKPVLCLREYRELALVDDPNLRSFKSTFDKVVVATPGTPKLSIEI